MLCLRLMLCTGWLLSVFAAAAVRADPMKTLTFIEVRSDAAERCRSILRQYEAARRGHTAPVDALVLEGTARPEKFALLEVDAGTDDAAGKEAARLLEPLTGLLTAPPDRRTHREFGATAAPARVPERATAAAASLYVITHLDIAPPERAKGEAALLHLAEQARRSAGNLRFEVWQQADRANHFNIIAAWRGRSEFDAFAAGSAAREFRKEVASLLGSPYDERLYRRAD